MDHPPEIAAMIAKYPSLKKPIETGTESHDGREQALLASILNNPALPQLKNSPTALLAAMDEFSSTHDFLISIGPHKASILSSLIEKEKPAVLVEIGGYLGYSAILFADAMRRARDSQLASGTVRGQELRVWSIEISEDFASIARQFIDLAGLGDIIAVVVGTADVVLKKLKDEGKLGGVDMLFLDHVEKLYVKDFKVVEELGLLRKGAVIAADNVVRPGAPEYREFVRGYPRLSSEGVRGLIQPGDFEDELEISHVVSD
ncbi:S-adenosyl-L-methionine-dependent methyltransferase [Leptodontidium sp. MPI-SDFR-AT-0119]|nr:S-adenosyl-L-methionine-dependent methyltransferase [Leptodontidium sp. MPI-SDFR-AT-0119]